MSAALLVLVKDSILVYFSANHFIANEILMQLTSSHIEAQLRHFCEPHLGLDLVATKAIKNIKIDGSLISIAIQLGFPLQTIKDKWIGELQCHLQSAFPENKLDIQLNTQIETHVGSGTVKALPNIKNIIAVASGKGGVGKSTLAVNLALALAQEGAKTGLLDADIYGPSQPSMLGLVGRPEIKDKKITPIKKHGIQAMSIGLLVEENAAVVWRGPMIAMALQQLLNDTQWEDLDYLVIDLPPGTGDIQLTLAQKIPVSGAIIVTTPQELALKDVRRACAMFQKLNVPLLGVVENMATHACANCGHVEAIFGEGGASKLSAEFGMPLLSRFPLDRQIGEETDSGVPPVVNNPEGAYAEQYRLLARTIAARLSLQAKSYSHKFPQIKVE
jgi:ATP-binding protein involved in chromosome partitioning